jgi:hypothetical protein
MVSGSNLPLLSSKVNNFVNERSTLQCSTIVLNVSQKTQTQSSNCVNTYLLADFMDYTFPKCDGNFMILLNFNELTYCTNLFTVTLTYTPMRILLVNGFFT